jgi:hypothetical protein
VPQVTGLRQLVHGTFMTKATWRARTSDGTQLTILADAMSPGELTVLVLPPTNHPIDHPTEPSATTLPDAKTAGHVAGHVAESTASPSAEMVELKQWEQRSFDDVRISTRMLTASVETPAWRVNITAKPIYGLVPPLLNATHVHGHWHPIQKRFDLLVHGSYPQPNAHGIIGQSYSGTATLSCGTGSATSTVPSSRPMRPTATACCRP